MTEKLGKHGRLETKPANKNKTKWRVLFWASLVVFIGAAAALCVYGLSYCSQSQKYEELARSMDVSDQVADYEAGNITLADIKLDWEALYARNADTIAWIYVPNSNINYPVVWCGDDDTYVTEPYEGEREAVQYGAIFLEAKNKPDLSDMNNLIYGHNLSNGSMFYDFGQLYKQEVFDQISVAYILSPTNNYKLQVRSVNKIKETETGIIAQNFGSVTAFSDYLNTYAANTLHTRAGAMSVFDVTKNFMFLTCADTGYRFMVFCPVVESAQVAA